MPDRYMSRMLLLKFLLCFANPLIGSAEVHVQYSTLESWAIFSTKSLPDLGCSALLRIVFCEALLCNGKRILSTSSTTIRLVFWKRDSFASTISRSLLGVPMTMRGGLVVSCSLFSCEDKSTPLTYHAKNVIVIPDKVGVLYQAMTHYN